MLRCFTIELVLLIEFHFIYVTEDFEHKIKGFLMITMQHLTNN